MGFLVGLEPPFPVSDVRGAPDVVALGVVSGVGAFGAGVMK
jgi:uncharacterized membrane protein YhiD involved in acid resistance